MVIGEQCKATPIAFWCVNIDDRLLNYDGCRLISPYSLTKID